MPQAARRTVTITGRPEGRYMPHPPRAVEASARSPRLVAVDRRRPRARSSERLGPRPDKVAMWAFVMALFLILVTVASSHAAA